MPTWAGQAVPSSRAWPRALPQPVSPHHQDGRQPAGRPPPGSARPGGVLRAPSLHRLRSAGTRPESSQAGAERRAQHCTKASGRPGPRLTSRGPRGPRAGARPPPPGRPRGLRGRTRRCSSRPPRRSLLGPRAPRRAPTSLPAGRGRVGHRNGGGLVTSAPRGRPWVPPPSRRSGASRADHSGQGAGRGPWASDVGLQALTSAEPHTACQGRPATRRNTGGGAGPEILGPHR